MKIKHLVRIILLSILFAALTACTTMEAQGNQALANLKPQDFATHLKVGVTSESEVRTWLGQPTSSSFVGDGAEEWDYTYSYVNGGESYVHAMTFGAVGNQGINSKRVSMLFNKAGILEKYTLTGYSN